MEFTICSFCAKTGMLCTRCKRKLAEGKITQLDLDVSKLFIEMESKYPSLQTVKISRILDAGSLVLLEVRKKDVLNIIGPNKQLINAIEDKLQRKIHLIERTKSARKIIESLFLPVEVLGVNTIFVPDGSEEFKVRVRRKDAKNLPINEKTLHEAAYSLLGRHIRIDWDE